MSEHFSNPLFQGEIENEQQLFPVTGQWKRTGIHKRDSNRGNIPSGLLASLAQQLEVEAVLLCQHHSAI